MKMGRTWRGLHFYSTGSEHLSARRDGPN